jgi:Domain of unknown function (DUF4062)
MKKKLQVFVSSTFTDLIDERQAAVSAILKAGHIPAGMELFTSGDESQMETIKRWIDESDIYMLILGGRYGSVEPTTSKSYTELEYDYAVSIGKPFFAVVIENEALDQKVKDKGREVLENDNPKELKIFREKVLSKMSAFFKDSSDIKLAVYETVADFAAKYDFKGWVSGDSAANEDILNELNELRKDKDQLQKELQSIKSSIGGLLFSEQQEREFEYIHESLKGQHTGICFLRRSDPDSGIMVEITYSLLRALRLNTLKRSEFYESSFLDSLAEELKNSESFIQYKIAPYRVSTIKPELGVEGLLRTKGFFIIGEKIPTSSFDQRDMTYSPKMYDFLNWLVQTEKYNSESKAEIVGALPIENRNKYVR